MSEVLVYRGNLVNVDTESIVCPANSSMMPGAGVNRTIFYSAGDDLYNYCLETEDLPVGKAMETPGFNIPVKYIIHTVGPYWHGGYEGEAGILASCYIECMKTAARLGLKSIAFPALSTGNGKYPAREAAEIAIYSVKSFLQNHPDVDMQVYMMCYTDDILIKFRNANMAEDLNILKYLKRKEVKVSHYKLNKEEVSLAKKGLFKKERSKEQIDKLVYTVLKSVVKKKRNLILLSSKMNKERITTKTCDANNGKTGPYVTLDTVDNIEIHEIKKGPFMIPIEISFIIHPYAYTKELEQNAPVKSKEKRDISSDAAALGKEKQEEHKFESIEDELAMLEVEYKEKQEIKAKEAAEYAEKRKRNKEKKQSSSGKQNVKANKKKVDKK